MTDETAPVPAKTPTQVAEEHIEYVLDGGRCSIQDHPALTSLECLMADAAIAYPFPLPEYAVK